jgi:hypothetical protein
MGHQKKLPRKDRVNPPKRGHCGCGGSALGLHGKGRRSVVYKNGSATWTRGSLVTQLRWVHHLINAVSRRGVIVLK